MSGARVLYVLGAHPVPSETFIRREISALRAAGLRVDVFCLRRGAGDAGDAVFAPPAAWFGGGRLAREGWCVARTRRDRLYALAAAPRVAWAARHFRGRGITRVHAHFATVPGLAGMWLARELGVPFSFTAHAYDLFTERSLFGGLAPAAEFIVVPAEYHRAWIRERHGAMAADKTQVVRCGVPDHYLRYPAADADGNTGVVGIGRLVPKKGFDLLARAMANLPEMRWQIIGDGPEYRNLLRLAPRARLLRWQDEEYTRFVQATNICMFPCRVLPDGDRDGLPVTLLEAMALGAPVVATPVAGIPEAIEHDVNGLLVPENDVAALAAAIRRLQGDRELRARLGAAARATVREKFRQRQSIRALLGMFGGPVTKAAGVLPARKWPLRVLRVINNLECGGAQRLLVQWAKHHDRARFHTVVAAFAGGPLAEELAATGVPVHILPRQGKHDITLIGRLAKLLRDEKIELVHAQLFAAKLWARLAARQAGLPCGVSEYAIHPRTRHGLYPHIERWLARHTAAWTVDYPELAEYVTGRYGAPYDRITTLTSGVETDRLRVTRPRAAIRAALGVPEDCLMALGLGRLTEQKGFARLFGTSAGRPNFTAELAGSLRVVIGGDGPQRAELAARFARPELHGRAQLAGPGWPVGELLAAADVLVLPSQWEGLPLVVLEAAAVGLPVIACDLPGLHQLAGVWPGLTLVAAADNVLPALLPLARDLQRHGRWPARVPMAVADAAAYAGRLAEWYDDITARA